MNILKVIFVVSNIQEQGIPSKNTYFQLFCVIIFKLEMFKIKFVFKTNKEVSLKQLMMIICC